MIEKYFCITLYVIGEQDLIKKGEHLTAGVLGKIDSLHRSSQGIFAC